VGSQSLTLAAHFPQLRFVVQDREPVVRDAFDVRCLRPTSPGVVMYLIKYGPQFWKKNLPEALESGRVKPQSSFISACITPKSHAEFSSQRPQLLRPAACAAR
jgi:hypothetical protein